MSGRKASGEELLEQAKACLSKAKSIRALKQAQAVVFPLAFGLSLKETAEAIGVSAGRACQLRTSYIRSGGNLSGESPKRGGRQHENMTCDEEAAFLAPFFNVQKSGGALVVEEIRQALHARLGRSVARSSVYNLLHRHGWRRLESARRRPKINGNPR